MALPPLATTADLLARNVDVPDSLLADTMLGVASSLVREACQGPVLRTTSTIALWSDQPGAWFDLPGRPIATVTAVAINGTDLITGGWTLVEDRLFLASELYWPNYGTVHHLTVTLTHGLPEVPEYIVQLVCDLAILGMKVAKEGAVDPRVVIEQIDDYKVTYTNDAKGTLVASALTLPEATRLSLRTRFGGNASLVQVR